MVKINVKSNRKYKIERSRKMIIWIVAAGARIYKIQRTYTEKEFKNIKKTILEQLRFIKYDDEQGAFICENKITAELVYSVFAQKVF